MAKAAQKEVHILRLLNSKGRPSKSQLPRNNYIVQMHELDELDGSYTINKEHKESSTSALPEYQNW